MKPLLAPCNVGQKGRRHTANAVYRPWIGLGADSGVFRGPGDGNVLTRGLELGEGF
jgi:hypothetical protein